MHGRILYRIMGSRFPLISGRNTLSFPPQAAEGGEDWVGVGFGLGVIPR